MRWLDRFRRDETGSATIEFVLWVPVIVALVAIVIDATTIYITHSEMWHVARDTARRMSSALIVDCEEAEQHALDSMGLRDYPYFVRAVYNEDNGATVIIAISVQDVAIVGVGSALYRALTLTGGDVVARSTLRPDLRLPIDCDSGTT